MKKIVLLVVFCVASLPAGYYTYLHENDTYHSQCTSGCLYTDPYGDGPGSKEIGVLGGCPAGHLKVNALVLNQAVPPPGAIDPWWIGNAGDDYTAGGILFTQGSCGDYFFGTEGQWDYTTDCDTDGDITEEDSTAGVC